MIDKFIVRDYRNGDYAGIKHLWSLTELSDPKRGDDEKIIEDSLELGGSLLILEEAASRKICGTSWMTFDGRRIHLHHFGILPELQQKGFAKILLKKSLDIVKLKGYQVKLEVNKKNIKAINLYNSFGFKSLGDYDILIIRDISKL